MEINSSLSELDFKVKKRLIEVEDIFEKLLNNSAEEKHSFCKEDEHNLLNI